MTKLCDILECGEEADPKCKTVIQYLSVNVALSLCRNHYRYIAPDLIGFSIRDDSVVKD